MLEIAVKPRGPYSLGLSARLAGDATRRFRDGVVTARYAGSVASAWQAPDGVVTIRSESTQAAEKLRWTLALDDDHSEFLRRFRDDPLLGRATIHLRGLRPVRTATVAQALLRAVCGQLVDWKTARNLERRAIKALQPRAVAATGLRERPAIKALQPRAVAATGLCEPPQTSTLAAAAPFELRRLGLHERRGASLVRLCRSLELERLHDLPTATVVARISRERGLGPWSAGVVCLEGLGRWEHGLVGDLGLVKYLRAARGREVETWETAELLEPYGEWAGLASVYFLAGLGRGLIPLPAANAA
jgi:3-methyladenine DNA glycosylase/8-oxoguanine DNA glycosylase